MLYNIFLKPKRNWKALKYILYILYMYIYMYMYVCVYIYIQIEVYLYRERQTDRYIDIYRYRQIDIQIKKLFWFFIISKENCDDSRKQTSPAIVSYPFLLWVVVDKCDTIMYDIV